MGGIRNAFTFSFRELFLFDPVSEPFECSTADDIRHNYGQCVRNKLRPDYSVKPNSRIHNEEQRNMEDTLTTGCQKQRLFTLSHCLHCICHVEIAYSQRRSKAHDTQEACGKLGCLHILYKNPCNIPAKISNTIIQIAAKASPAILEKFMVLRIRL